MKDILNIERVQRRATKYILNDYTSSYKTRLIKLKLLPLMYLFELHDILFATNQLKHQPSDSILPITSTSTPLTLDQAPTTNSYLFII